ncbi:MAG: cysteine--tRNA ligase, partial [Candidatus Omnitrophica bacterium]|nr:cysteine--tRNA ligase [Candidatus Omnitrophota bacterium]
YNSLTKKKEPFVPLEAGKVKMYVCGPTVYDEPHIGHLRSAYVFEVIRNYLEYSGYQVRFVRNVTDVDDKIIEKAREGGIQAEEVSGKYYRSYKDELKAFGIREPDEEPRATGHIGEMVTLIQRLIERGVAYPKEGDVYFRVGAFKEYGKLSGQKTESMLENARIDPNEKKESPLDFALWKKSKEGEPSWPSPWGPGRPGWHIECSAMSMGCLKSETIDIHGGGRDLIFPHHENEIAQSESATGKPFANFWIHHGLVTVNEQKMSKSLKNFITLRSFLEKYGEKELDELRILFLSTHYSMPLNYSEEKITTMTHSIWKRFHYFFDEVNQLKEGRKEIALPPNDKLLQFESEFRKAMDDDFNVPLVFMLMHRMMHEARETRDPQMMFGVAGKIEKWGKDIFLLFSHWNEAAFFSTRRTGRIIGSEDMELDRDIAAQISKRHELRDRKAFKEADAIRSELSEKGIELVDWKNGRTTWRRKID